MNLKSIRVIDNRLTSEAIHVLKMESRRRRELEDEAIGNLLEDSDIGDFIPSDDDYDDPEFVRPETSISSTEEESDGPDVSTSFIQARGRTRRGTRGVSRGLSRGRSRGRTRNSTGSRKDNNILSTTYEDWSQQEFSPIQRFLTEPSYLPFHSEHFSKMTKEKIKERKEMKIQD